MLFCVDIGNTHTHFATVGEDGAVEPVQELPTGRVDHPLEGLAPRLREVLQRSSNRPEAVAFCSVVPAANVHFRRALAPLGLPLWQLTHEVPLGVAISYPNPTEIGQDRLANAAGAQALCGTPAIVIDLGTAVTFDIVTRSGGYEGGIIAPGPALMTRYLHERTAQLPLVEDLTTPLERPIGRSTAEAMRIGAVLGFAGLIQACLDAVLADFAARGEPEPVILTCGGAATAISGRLRQSVRDVPDLTLRGLTAAWRLSNRSDPAQGDSL
jgi:type III pantothenate kinase